MKSAQLENPGSMALPLNTSVLPQTLYTESWQAMKDFVARRSAGSCDEIWYVEHPPVFTQGMAGKAGHLLDACGIPLVQSDRGGQITYHGPGQIIAYCLIDIARRQLGVRKLVELLETAVIAVLKEYGIKGKGDREAPGVYVDGEKIAALGLRVRRHSTYHGLSLNVDLDLSPYQQINPCGYQGMRVTSLKKLGLSHSVAAVRDRLHYHLCSTLNYDYYPLTAQTDRHATK